MDGSWLVLAALLVGPVLLAAIVAGLLGFVGTHRWTWVAAISSPFMFFTIPIGGIFPSMNLLAGLAAVKGALAPAMWRLWWFRCGVALVSWPLIALAWSPNPVAGLRDFVYALPFFFLAGAACQYDQDGGAAARRVLKTALLLSSIQAVLIIVFRLSPQLESGFVTSTVARLFISPNVIDALFAGSPNNIFDPGKAGGFFVNANTAATFSGTCLMLAWYLGRAEQLRTLQAVALLHWVAVVFTGSKAGVLCAAALPAALMLIGLVRTRRINMVRATVMCFAMAVVVALLPLAFSYYESSGFTRESVDTFSVRTRIWDFAWTKFLQHPLLGLGHGGWEAEFPFFALAQGLNPQYPPHNAFILLWARAGIVAPLLGLAFAVTFVWWCARCSRGHDNAKNLLALGLGGAFTWLLVQAQGENFGLIGEPHVSSMIALAAGIVAQEARNGSAAKEVAR